MKTYILDVIHRIRRFSEELDVATNLCNRTWTVFNDTGEREVYIFQNNGSVIITSDGIGIQGKWTWMPEDNTLIINKDGNVIMLHPEYIDKTILALTLDGTNKISFLIDQKNNVTFAPKTLDQLEQYFIDKEQRLIEAENLGIIVPDQESPEDENIKKEAKELSDSKLKGEPLFLLSSLCVLLYSMPIFGTKTIHYLDSLLLSHWTFIIIFLVFLFALIRLGNYLESIDEKMWHKMKIRNWVKNHPNDPRNRYLLQELNDDDYIFRQIKVND